MPSIDYSNEVCGVNVPIMTLPVYRLTREKYYKQLEHYVDQQIFGGPSGVYRREYAKDNQEWVKNFSNHLHQKFGGSWEYNEIIGFIELHFCGTQIRGEYFENNKIRQVRTRKKQFTYITHKLAPEINIHYHATSQDVESIIDQYIENCRQELKVRYIDDSAFTNLKGYVDWISLLNKAHG